MAMIGNPGASKAVMQFVYDIGNNFYHLWLDDTKTYSCAFWEGVSSLEEAQLKKLDYHITEANASGASRVLDIGCGWGSALRRMVQHHRVHHAVGLTLSEAQAEYVRALNDDRIEVHVESWSEHEPNSPYDAVISIGAFEHFARPDAPHSQKIEGYIEFFERSRRWLRPGGFLALQTIVYENSDRSDLHPFVQEFIWPETDMPRLADIATACERRFEVVRLRNDRDDYARTCREWIRRITQKRHEIVALVGEEMVQRFERWLKLSMIGFHTGAMSLLRITFARLD